jgi:phosphoribosylamine--glycine ligase
LYPLSSIIVIYNHLLTEGGNVLIVGSGGREHALGWKLSQSKLVRKTYFATGNGGTFENINIQPTEISKLVTFAKQNKCFTIVGPEIPLANGLVNSFVKEGLRVFGPTKEAALLESSKEFAKQFMNKNGIPTANFRVFSDAEKAKDYVVKQGETKLVIKADGLAAGKGVVVCNNLDEAIDAVDMIMVRNEFGTAGQKIIIEEQLCGEELSFIALCDGRTIIPLASCQDHKRIFDNNMGPNTGGMGSYSPTPVIDSKLHEKIMKQIMVPAIRGMNFQGNPYKGFLYAGLMIDEQRKEPFVLEFNVRMGDPECQPIMMRMESDLFEYLDSAVDEKLYSLPPIQWKNQFAVCVIVASKGYPGAYAKCKLIKGLEHDFGHGTMVFHADTALDSQKRIITNGGRVLGVTATGDSIKRAIDNAYFAVQKISWNKNGCYYRTDIARKHSHVRKPASFFP